MAIQYRNKKNILDKKEQELDNPEENPKFRSFLNSFLADVLIFTATLITLIIALVIIYVMYGQSKLKALVTNIAMQRIKTVEAADMSNMLCTCKMQWYIMGMLTIITLGMLYLITNKLTLSTPHMTIVVISCLVEKVPLLELLCATKFSVRLV